MRTYRHLLYSLLFMIGTLMIGTIGYQLTEHLSMFDALWLTTITMMTVGYGDVIPTTEAGKIFTLVMVPIGIGVVTYALGVLTAWFIEQGLSLEARRKRMLKEISKLENHYIVCGVGRVGEQVLQQLVAHRETVVCIESDEKQIDRLSDKIYILTGDATDDEILLKAGVKKAKGLVTTLPDDAQNVYVTLSAKGMAPDIQVVARAIKTETEEKLYRAGADKVINPSSNGGKQMALSILKPASVKYVDTIMLSHNTEFMIEEYKLPATSQLVNKSIRESNIRNRFGVTIVAIQRYNELINNPSANELLYENDLLIMFGTRQQLEKLETC
ncbi:potassium channel protein [Bacillus sp. HMF5848]|uniref:potassium channel family protein n=1 Tax=Bacillus sp. HMF5848 TaxID=2495421 RepID=UPI000F78F2F6|nr:potassium channel protein [Bacillus sp. HMF5848]RSK29007.1 potassium channel protein [Bacillus sp. HMF5848]